MLCNSHGRPWADEASITKAIRKRVMALGLDDGLSPHRLRNNAATSMIIAGLDDRSVADAMGWALSDVEEMRRIYVDREAVVMAAVVRLSERNKK